jgi:hypothetical protein
MQKPAELADKFFGVPYQAPDERAKNVARLIAERKHVARDSAKELDAAMTREASARPMPWPPSAARGYSSRVLSRS